LAGLKGLPYTHSLPTPRFIQPMTATLVQSLPEGDQWLYELKLDGYRALLIKEGEKVRIISRNQNDLTANYPAIVAAATKLKTQSAVLDGEVVALDAHGRPSFQALQHRATQGSHAIAYYAFDLLHLDGRDLTREPLDARRTLLPKVLKGGGILLSDELKGTAAQVTEVVRRLGLEGVIAKRRDSRYDAGQRSGAWLKLKLERQQEFVIGGYRPGPHGIDALLVGFYDGPHLKFAAKVRAGFTSHLRREVFEAISPLRVASCPFADLPHTRVSRWGGGVTAEQMDEMTWVKPKLVAQIRFVEWTADQHLRHAAYMGLRTDKRARDVRKE
jgi:bifunctional non-homologous end joining protein LigD